MQKVLLGLSGGVDSAVSAALLRRAGYEVHGLYLDGGTGDGGAEDAARAAEMLSIPLDVADIRAELESKVCVPFTQCYLNGETPNPCILCNPAVKFRHLLSAADRIGAEWIATGHYARTGNGAFGGTDPADGTLLQPGAVYRAVSSKDQSYMLCRLTRAQADRLLLPLGDYEKTEVRAMAEEFGLALAHKPDSMEICFIPDKDYIGWLGRRTPLPGPGDFVFHGEVIGRHDGICSYTVGQRRPGLWQERKLYISKIDAVHNTIELALWEELFTNRVSARDMSWLTDVPSEPLRGSIKVRHTKWEQPECTVTPRGDGGITAVTDSPLRAPARGQSAVIYRGARLLGGGFIE